MIFLKHTCLCGLVLVMSLWQGCEWLSKKKILYKEFTKVGKRAVWQKNNPIKFVVDVPENDDIYDVYITLRHNTAYAYEGIRFLIHYSDPNGNNTTIQKAFPVRGQDGTFIGKGMGNLWDIEFPLWSSHRFSSPGKHYFYLSHDMPVENLPMVVDVGLLIEAKPSP